MTDKQFNRNAIIVGVVVIIGLLLWFASSKTVAGEAAAAPGVTPAGSPTFGLQGYNTPGLGPFNFPVSVINLKPEQPPGSLNSGNCSCGCDGSGGNTTVNFQLPGIQGLIDQLAANNNAAMNASYQASLASMGSPEGVFVSNGSPTIFSGGNPFNTYADYAHVSNFDPTYELQTFG